MTPITGSALRLWDGMAKEKQNPETKERGDSVLPLYEQCGELLAGLDELGLHQAAAHVSMAQDVMRRSFPHLVRDE
jgi:hypothetical protein